MGPMGLDIEDITELMMFMSSPKSSIRRFGLSSDGFQVEMVSPMLAMPGMIFIVTTRDSMQCEAARTCLIFQFTAALQ